MTSLSSQPGSPLSQPGNIEPGTIDTPVPAVTQTPDTGSNQFWRDGQPVAGLIGVDAGSNQFWRDGSPISLLNLPFVAPSVISSAALTAATITVSAGGGIQLILPVSDLVLGTWTSETGGTTNIYQSVAEPTADDTTYIQSVPAPVNSQYTMRLGPQPRLPLIGPIILHIRHDNEVGGLGMNYTYEIMQGATILQTFGPYIVSSSTPTEVDAVVTTPITDWATPFDLRVTATEA